MKPMSPEEKELEQLRSDVAQRYGAIPHEQPPARLDDAILAAARRELDHPAVRRNWQVPASVAAVLVVGVTLSFMTREIEEPLPQPEAPVTAKADLAKAAPDGMALKAAPESSARNVSRQRDSRPSRERTARSGLDEAAEIRADQASKATDAARQTVPAGVAATPGPAVADQSKAPEREETLQDARAVAPAGAASAEVKAKKPEEVVLRKEAAATITTDEDARERELGRIGELLRDGKREEARQRLLEFRRRYPGHPLSPSLQQLLPPEDR
jgi:hypothetical protein